MEFSKLAKERYSLRKFDQKQIEKIKLEIILHTASLSPTACNNQPQRILVIDSEDALEKIRSCTKYHFEAPTVILICYDKTKSWVRSFDGKDSGYIDASIVATHIMFQATELGLGTTFVEFFDPKLVIDTFNLDDNIVPVAIIPIGYPATDASPSPLHDQRIEINKTVFYNSF